MNMLLERTLGMGAATITETPKAATSTAAANSSRGDHTKYKLNLPPQQQQQQEY